MLLQTVRVALRSILLGSLVHTLPCIEFMNASWQGYRVLETEMKTWTIIINMFVALLAQ